MHSKEGTIEGKTLHTLASKSPAKDKPLSTILRSEFNRSKVLLKMFRSWRLYAKQQVYRRKKRELLELEAVRHLQSAVEKEHDLSQELQEEHGLLDSIAIATNFYQDSLCRRVLKSLRAHVSELSEHRATIAS